MEGPDLFSERTARPRRRGGGRPLRPLSWLPVLLALGLFAQICLGGLRPALREEARLEGVAAELEARRARLVGEARELELLLSAQRDPVYQERLRRRGLDPRSGPAELTAEARPEAAGR